MKKGISVLLAVLLIAACPFAVLAEDAQQEYQSVSVAAPTRHLAVSSKIEELVDITQLRSYLVEQLTACNQWVDLSAFEIKFSDDAANVIGDFIFYNLPEAFHVERLHFYLSGTKLIAIVPDYTLTPAEFETMYTACQEQAARLLDGIQGNDSLSEAEKALLLHDRLAVHCEYDTTFSNENQFNMYGALVDRVAVCDGYTRAYAFLLNQIGIENVYCSSDAMNHSWNIVYIDGRPYHVDVTQDDPIGDLTGRVNHTFFLRSSEGIYAAGHDADDYDTTPTDTTYDAYEWHTSKSAFQLVGGQLYYIDHTNNVLKRFDENGSQTLTPIQSTWKAGMYAYWAGNYARLGSYGSRLFYSLYDKVYEYDLASGVSTVVCEPDVSALPAYTGIYGFTYEDGYFVLDLCNTPNITGTRDNVTQIRVLDVNSLYDLNADGFSNEGDFIHLRKSLLGIGTPIEALPAKADFTSDGTIDLRDLVRQYKILFAA